MIASVTGVAEHVGLDRIVVRVGGIGVLVHTTPATAAAARTGTDCTLATTLIVREDSLTLYGFATADERAMFETVQTVTGVGPRLALAMLSVLAPDDLARAVTSNDLATLTKVPGVGKKGAERIVLELRDKVGVPAAGQPVPAGGSAQSGIDQVTDALIGLGWSAKVAGDTLSRISAQPDAPTEVALLLRAALRELGK